MFLDSCDNVLEEYLRSECVSMIHYRLLVVTIPTVHWREREMN